MNRRASPKTKRWSSPIKRLKFLFVPAALAALLCPPAAAVDITWLVTEIQRHHEEALARSGDLRADMEVVSPESRWRVTLYRKGPLFRIERMLETAELSLGAAERAAVRTVVVHDGKKAWFEDPERGVVEIATPVREIPPFVPWWRHLSHRSELVGEVIMRERDCFVIQLEPGPFSFAKVWVAKGDWALVHAEQLDPNGFIIAWEFSDFRDAGKGRLYPHRVDVYENGQHALEMRLTRLLPDEELPAAWFRAGQGAEPPPFLDA